MALTVSTITAAAVYYIRATEARPVPQAASTSLEPQVEGRLVEPISGEGLDGRGYFGLCEYDAWIELKDGIVISVRDGIFGPRIPASKGRPVERGESAEGISGWQPPLDSGWEPGVTIARIYRDDAGKLKRGCAPESVVTYAKSPPYPLTTPAAPAE
jgi:hypothetical protein